MKKNILIKTYDELWLMIIVRISFVNKKMLSFIDCSLCVIK